MKVPIGIIGGVAATHISKRIKALCSLVGRRRSERRDALVWTLESLGIPDTLEYLMSIALLPSAMMALHALPALSPAPTPAKFPLSAAALSRTVGLNMALDSMSDGLTAEENRKNLRTIYMHPEWVEHRKSDRIYDNLKSMWTSTVAKSVEKEVLIMTGIAVAVCALNMLVVGYQDFGGIYHESDLLFPPGTYHPRASIPAQPFSIAMPALSLLLVFRTNTGYARWNEARTLWGGVINNCRNIARQVRIALRMSPRIRYLYEIASTCHCCCLTFHRTLFALLPGQHVLP